MKEENVEVFNQNKWVENKGRNVRLIWDFLFIILEVKKYWNNIY